MESKHPNLTEDTFFVFRFKNTPHSDQTTDDERLSITAEDRVEIAQRRGECNQGFELVYVSTFCLAKGRFGRQLLLEKK